MSDKSNTGWRNSGDYNSGHCNSGDYNSGRYNSGDYNSGDFNTGHYNSGDYNSGHCNSGDFNTGHYNSGDYNSGHCNSGDYNSGRYNSGDYNSGYFCTETPKPMFFDQPADLEWDDVEVPWLDLPVGSEWVAESDMTDEQKVENSNYKTFGGYLKRYDLTVQEAFPIAWAKADDETKQKFLDLPNFDAEKFLKCTGVDVREKKAEEPKTQPERIQINGVWYVPENNQESRGGGVSDGVS